MTRVELSKIYDLKDEIQDTKNYLDYINDLLKNIVPKNDGTPRGSNISDKIGKLTSSKVDTENHLKKLREKLSLAKIELAVKISTQPITELQRQILMLRYIDGLKLTEVSENLTYSYEWIKWLHRDALHKILEDYSGTENNEMPNSNVRYFCRR